MPEINTGDTAWVLMSTRARHAHDAGPRPLLRRAGAPQERALHDHAQLLHPRPGQRDLGPVGLHARLRPRHRLGLIGGLDWLALEGVPASRPTSTPPRSRTWPFMAFQMMFAIITPALITGAFAERKRFKAFVLFAVAWATFVYAPIAHWVWAPDGWLFGPRRARLRRRHRRPHLERRRRAGRRALHRPPHRADRAARPSRTTCR